MTVCELTEAIVNKSGVKLPISFPGFEKKIEKTGDELITGNEEAKITGIGVTFMATADVIRRAAAAGINTIITHEPTFFTSNDRRDWGGDDPVYQLKQKLITETGMNIWRFHDYTHFRQPDLIYEGMVHELGWKDYEQAGDQKIFNLPGWTVRQLAEVLKEKLQTSAIRLVGDEKAICNRVCLLVGAMSLGLGRADESLIQYMNHDDCDALIGGEMHEWTTCAYMRDAGMLGVNKAMLILGHNRSEEAGMKYIAEWIRPLCGDIPVSFIEAGDPFQYFY
ncbi:hypothetical protein FACS189483_07860 [Spirochaetia bacterium]|nr:hypothetical protein FACS189483_07860 [Spirochaetia bacterium]